MKKILSIALAFMLVAVSLVGCAGDKDNAGTGDSGKKPIKGADITLITDKGNIDDKSFNQGAWEGVVQFATENEVPHTYIKPEEDGDAGYLAAIKLAVEGGAKVVVTPGYLFEVAVHNAQTEYPEVKFILLDGQPHEADSFDGDIKENTVGVFYSEEQSGYLAGYAAVQDGLTDLGFMGGMAVPAVQAFGYGYLQGAEQAAEDLELEDGAITSIYHYTGNFDENDTNKATAKTMYQEGMEVIFACGGSVGKSVMSAANASEGKVIGVDVDQRYDSETVMTSATKGLASSVVAILDSIYKTEDFATKFGGQAVTFNAENEGVSLPTEVIGDDKADAFDRFEKFDKAAYDTLFETLKSGDVDVKRVIEVADPSGNATGEELTEQLGLKKVSVKTR